YPYRALFKVLYELDYITKFEFTWCLYPLRDTSDQAIQLVIERITELRETYSNLEVLNEEMYDADPFIHYSNKLNIEKRITSSLSRIITSDNIYHCRMIRRAIS